VSKTATRPIASSGPTTEAQGELQPARRARVVAVANQKGGVGKTTTAQALGTALADMGDRVLLVDLDPQASLTISLGYNPAEMTQTIYNVMCEYTTQEAPATSQAVIAIDDHLSLIPSNRSLSAAEIMLLQRMRREYVLADALEPILGAYDWIFLDCPPSLSILTVNALACADSCIVPVHPEPLVTAAVESFFELIFNVRRSRLNPRLTVAGIILTRVDPRPTLDREVIEQFTESLRGQVPILGSVRNSVRVREASAQRIPLTRYRPAAEAASAYRQIAEDLRVTSR
jgi:chromosome partitioning protein